MVSEQQLRDARTATRDMLARLSIVLTPDEAGKIEVADFGLGELMQTGLQLITYINTERVCAKELIMFPGQTCPEHQHPPAAGEPGKEETFRCRWGEVYLYVQGKPASQPKCAAPKGSEEYFTVWHEVHLRPGEQHTIYPETRHWFQAGKEGAIVSEFSTTSRDQSDIFTDPRIVR
jgi:D-lyxose ketol-isomerase